MQQDRAALLRHIDDFAKARVLCVGDVMLDRYIYGAVERISPEAPIPIIREEQENIMLGGAGNVVRNIISLGGAATFVSVVGNDESGHTITALTGKEPRVEPYLLMDKQRISTEKTRYVAGSQQMFRADRESDEPVEASVLEKVESIVTKELPDHAALVLSDYGKGVLTPELTGALIAAAKRQGVPVIVDPKSRDFTVYRGATVLTPNQRELGLAAGKKLRKEEDIVKVARMLMERCDIAHMVVTRGGKGMLVIESADQAQPIAAEKREVFDVSGAGDTAVATLGVAIASGADLMTAAFLANLAAGIVVGKIGTAAVYRTDLKTAVHTHGVATGQRKIYPLDLAADQVAAWQEEGLTVGFTNGCFDILHAGHLALLSDAKHRCDRLVVAINSDDSVKRLKGAGRPVNAEMDRAMLLAELQAVDVVVIFREDTPEAVLKRLKPSLLMKGADYEAHEIVGAEFVKSYGGEVVRIPLKEGYSTTGTIEKIVSQK